MRQSAHVTTREPAKDRDYQATFMVDKSTEEVFAAILDVRGWWSDSIEGRTDATGAEFRYHFRDIHRCSMKISEIVPYRRVVWHVTDNYFNFIADQSEWKGTDIVFEISRKDENTELRFTHRGLVPEYECFEICRDAWTDYITGSLKNLILTGKGRPNMGEALTVDELKLTGESFTLSFEVNKSPNEVFDAINRVADWWSGEPGVTGSALAPGDEFTYRYADLHVSRQRVTELVPGKKVVWKVIEANLSFTAKKDEWKNTELIFDIRTGDGKTEVRFTHLGLIPKLECFEDCSGAWAFYATNSLRSLIETGTGESSPAW